LGQILEGGNIMSEKVQRTDSELSRVYSIVFGCLWAIPVLLFLGILWLTNHSVGWLHWPRAISNALFLHIGNTIYGSQGFVRQEEIVGAQLIGFFALIISWAVFFFFFAMIGFCFTMVFVVLAESALIRVLPSYANWKGIREPEPRTIKDSPEITES
jgi:hypothetical protein